MDLVFIHGPAAAGKLTIARKVAEATGYPLFHNHLIVDAVVAVFPFGTAPFARLREQFWLATFAEAAQQGRPLVFTFTPEATVPAGFADRVVETVEAAGGRVRFVALAVSEAEQERRLVSKDRARYGKLRSVEVLRRLRLGADPERPPAELVIDTEALSADEAARRIVAGLALPPLRPPHRPFPD
jgi:cytidylate kinase